MSEALIVNDYDQFEPLPETELVLVAEAPSEQELFNVIDLIEQLEDQGYSEAEISFAAQALRGEKVSLDDLRKTDWSFLRLSKEEFGIFSNNLSDLKRRLSDFLGGSGIRSHWTAEERAGQTSYMLWLGKDTELEAVQARSQRKAKRARKQPEYIETRTEPESGTFEEYWKFHEKRLRYVAQYQFRFHENTLITPEDLVQDVALELAELFEERGKNIFEGGFLQNLMKYRLIDLLRKQDPSQRKDARVSKMVDLLFDSVVARADAERQIQDTNPTLEPARVQRIVESVYQGKKRSPSTLYIEDLEFFEPRADTEPIDPRSYDADPERVAEFLEKYLANSEWSTVKQNRMIEVAKLRFIEGLKMLEISEKLGVTESRISQLFSQDIVPILRRNVLRDQLGCDDVAEKFYSDGLM